MERAPTNRTLVVLLAVLLPALITGGFFTAMATYEPQGDPEWTREMKNAGRVLNGRRLRRSVVEEMEAVLDRREPEVIVLGNSAANTNIDVGILARGLGVPEKKVVVFSIPNSVSSHWYAVLKNRVYANGHHPPLVIIVSPLRLMLWPEPYSEAGYQNLFVQMGEHEPEIDKWVDRGGTIWTRIRTNRGALREESLAMIRDNAVGLFFGGPEFRVENERAMQRLFADRNVDQARHRNATLVHVSDGRQDLLPEVFPEADETLLPALADLATENGTKLVFVRHPWAPRSPDWEVDRLPRETELGMERFARERGHAFISTFRYDMPDGLFDNAAHLNAEGAQLYTRLLVPLLEQVNALGPPGARAYYPAPRPTVEWPEPSAVPEELRARFASTDGVWIGPGQTGVVRFDEGWPHPPGYFRVHLLAERFGTGGRPKVTVDGRPARLQVIPGGRNREIYEVQVRQPVPDAPWTIEVAMPEGKAQLLIGGLWVGRGSGARQIVGRYRVAEPARFDLFGNPELDGAFFEHAFVDVSFARPPARKEISRNFTHRQRRGVGEIDAADLAHLSDAATRKATALGVRCSPVRVLEDGVPLAHHNEPCNEVIRRPTGKVCHMDQKVIFGSSDEMSIREHRYELVLDPERFCHGGRWLYPRDQMRIDVPPALLQRFRTGVRSLRLSHLRMSPRSGQVHVVVKVGGKPLIRQSLQVGPDTPKHTILPLPRPIWPDAEDVVIELRNEAGFVLLPHLVLEQRAAATLKKELPGARVAGREPPAASEGAADGAE